MLFPFFSSSVFGEFLLPRVLDEAVSLGAQRWLLRVSPSLQSTWVTKEQRFKQNRSVHRRAKVGLQLLIQGTQSSFLYYYLLIDGLFICITTVKLPLHTPESSMDSHVSARRENSFLWQWQSWQYASIVELAPTSKIMWARVWNKKYFHMFYRPH